MPSDAAHRRSVPSTPIRLPDQLQQARASDRPSPETASAQSDATGRGDGHGDEQGTAAAPRPRAGILGQLESERAHD